MEGWIKIHRKMLENPIVCKDSSYLAVWIYLLLNATHKEIPALFKGKKIVLQKGQLITGRKSIAKQLQISESKVKRILFELESDQQIDRQRSNQNSLISILNWDKYQEVDQENGQQMDSQWTTSGQPVTTNKNVKNVKNERNNNISAKANKQKYGEYGNVLLKDEELQKLKEEYENWEDLIKYLDEYIEMKGYKAKSHYLCIKKWVVKAVSQDKAKQQTQDDSWERWLKESG